MEGDRREGVVGGAGVGDTCLLDRGIQLSLDVFRRGRRTARRLARRLAPP